MNWALRQLEKSRRAAIQFWNQVGLLKMLSPGLITFAFLMHLVSIVAYEAERLNLELMELWLTTIVGEAAFWITYLILHAVFSLALRTRYRTLAKIFVVASVSVSVRAIAIEWHLQYQGFIAEMEVGTRLPGDISFAVLMFLGIGYIITGRVLLREQEAEEMAKSVELVAQKQASRDGLSWTEHVLQQRAQEALFTELDAIKKLLTAADRTAVAKIADEIRMLINDKVRPLSHEIWNRATLLEQKEVPEQVAYKSGSMPRVIYPQHAMRPMAIFMLATPNIFLTALSLGGWGFAVALLGIGLVTFIPIAGAIRLLFPRTWTVSFFPGLALLLAITVLAYLPSCAFLFFQGLENPKVAVLQQSATLVMLFVAFSMGVWSAFFRQRESHLDKMTEINSNLRREISLLDQAVWVARRHWSYLIHGTVQGALTVAHSRLQLNTADSSQVISQVLSDIDRAREALVTGQELCSDLSTQLKEIQDTWDGVLALSLDIDPRVFSVSQENSTVSTCLVEICKELVSNAFKHAGADKMLIKISASETAQEFKLLATNNGRAPDPTSPTGLGSEMFSELTSHWELRHNGKHTRFKATVPFVSSREAIPASS
jgi:two-component sensor histidine kinase